MTLEKRLNKAESVVATRSEPLILEANQRILDLLELLTDSEVEEFESDYSKLFDYAEKYQIHFSHEIFTYIKRKIKGRKIVPEQMREHYNNFLNSVLSRLSDVELNKLLFEKNIISKVLQYSYNYNIPIKQDLSDYLSKNFQ